MTYRGMQPVQDAFNAPGAWRVRDVYTRLLAGTWPVASAPPDPNFAYVQVMLQPTVADVGVALAKDYSAFARTITKVGTVPLSGDGVFGGYGSFDFNGINANRLTVAAAPFASVGQKTLEFWVRRAAASSSGAYTGIASNGGWSLNGAEVMFINDTLSLAGNFDAFALWVNGANIVTNTSTASGGGAFNCPANMLPIGVWVHVAMCFNVLTGTAQTTTWVGPGRQSGGDGGNLAYKLAGLRIDSFRRHSGTTITVPTAPFPTRGPVVWNPLDTSSATLSDGLLTMAYASGGGWASGRATVPLTGKRYLEVRYNSGGLYAMPGVAKASAAYSTNFGFVGTADGVGYSSQGGAIWRNQASAAYGAAYAPGDVIGVMFDADTGKLWFAKNGVVQASGNPAAGTNPAATLDAGPWYPALSVHSANTSATARFKQSEWSYVPPSGFTAIEA